MQLTFIVEKQMTMERIRERFQVNKVCLSLYVGNSRNSSSSSTAFQPSVYLSPSSYPRHQYHTQAVQILF